MIPILVVVCIALTSFLRISVLFFRYFASLRVVLSRRAAAKTCGIVQYTRRVARRACARLFAFLRIITFFFIAVDSIGTVVPVSDPAHQAFYAVKQRMGNKLFYLFPVGYRTSRNFKEKHYVCTITREGNRPMFTVTEYDSSGNMLEQVRAPNPSQAAKECIGSNVSGPQFFGLSVPFIHNKILKLPGASEIVAEIDGKLADLGNSWSSLSKNDPRLRRHSVSGEDTRACGWCKTTFSTPASYHAHVEAHHGEDRDREQSLSEEVCNHCGLVEYRFWAACDSCGMSYHQGMLLLHLLVSC